MNGQRLCLKSARVGLEPDYESAEFVSKLGQSPKSRAAESGAVETQNHPEAERGDAGPVDPDLARVIAVWPMLPADVKAAIVGIVERSSE